MLASGARRFAQITRFRLVVDIRPNPRSHDIGITDALHPIAGRGATGAEGGHAPIGGVAHAGGVGYLVAFAGSRCPALGAPAVGPFVDIDRAVVIENVECGLMLRRVEVRDGYEEAAAAQALGIDLPIFRREEEVGQGAQKPAVRLVSIAATLSGSWAATRRIEPFGIPASSSWRVAFSASD